MTLQHAKYSCIFNINRMEYVSPEVVYCHTHIEDFVIILKHRFFNNALCYSIFRQNESLIFARNDIP